MRLQAPIKPHSDTVMVLDLVFYTKDPDDMGDAINIFLFFYLSPASGSKAALLEHRWYVILGGGGGVGVSCLL